MAEETLVGIQLEEGWKLIQQLRREGFDVQAALWLKKNPDASWNLYLVSPLVNGKDMAKTHRRVWDIIDQMPQPFWLDPFDISLIGLKDPIAKGVLELHEQYPNMKATHRSGGRLGNVTFEDAYIYPPIQQVVQEKS